MKQFFLVLNWLVLFSPDERNRGVQKKEIRGFFVIKRAKSWTVFHIMNSFSWSSETGKLFVMIAIKLNCSPCLWCIAWRWRMIVILSKTLFFQVFFSIFFSLFFLSHFLPIWYIYTFHQSKKKHFGELERSSFGKTVF